MYAINLGGFFHLEKFRLECRTLLSAVHIYYSYNVCERCELVCPSVYLCLSGCLSILLFHCIVVSVVIFGGNFLGQSNVHTDRKLTNLQVH